MHAELKGNIHAFFTIKFQYGDFYKGRDERLMCSESHSGTAPRATGPDEAIEAKILMNVGKDTRNCSQIKE